MKSSKTSLQFAVEPSSRTLDNWSQMDPCVCGDSSRQKAIPSFWMYPHRVSFYEKPPCFFYVDSCIKKICLWKNTSLFKVDVKKTLSRNTFSTALDSYRRTILSPKSLVLKFSQVYSSGKSAKWEHLYIHRKQSNREIKWIMDVRIETSFSKGLLNDWSNVSLLSIHRLNESMFQGLTGKGCSDVQSDKVIVRDGYTQTANILG